MRQGAATRNTKGYQYYICLLRRCQERAASAAYINRAHLHKDDAKLDEEIDAYERLIDFLCEQERRGVRI